MRRALEVQLVPSRLGPSWPGSFLGIPPTSGDKHDQRSMAEETEECNFVEFRGISSHYVASETIPVSFRYPIDCYQPTREDWVGLFRAEDSPRLDQYTARVYCGDPSAHRPCDGGIWKSGKVIINAGELPDNSDRVYLLLYVSSGVVVGRSVSFTICRDMSEFPSIQIQSMEDHVYIEKLREHSLTSDGGSSSFAMVTEEGSMELLLTSLKGKDLLESQGHDPGNGRWSEPELISYPDLNTTEEPFQQPAIESGSLEETPSGNIEEPPLGYQLCGGSVVQTCVESLPDQHTGDTQECIAGSHDLIDDIPEDEVFLRQLSLSESVVMVEGMSQREAWWFKNNNRELRTKLRKLTGVLETLSKEKAALVDELTHERQSKEQLLESISEGESEKARLENAFRELSDKNKQLLEQKSSLENKVQELEGECAMVSEHCSRVLSQVEQCETELKVVCSEKAVLEEKIVRTQKQLKDARKQLEGRKHEGRSKHEVRSKDMRQGGEGASKGGHEGLTKHDSRREEHMRLEGVKRHEASKEGHMKHKESSSKEGHMRRHEEGRGLKKLEKQGLPKPSSGGEHAHKSSNPPKETPVAQVLTNGDKVLMNGGVSVLMMGASDVRRKEDVRRTDDGAVRRTDDGAVRRRDDGDVRATDITPKKGLAPQMQSSRKPLLSEDRVQEITSRLKGNVAVFECPVCHQMLHSRETEFSATLHIEHCLALHEGQ